MAESVARSARRHAARAPIIACWTIGLKRPAGAAMSSMREPVRPVISRVPRWKVR